MRYRSPDSGRFLVVPQVEAMVGDAATLRLTTIQEWGRETVSIAQQRLVAARDTSVHFGEVGLGGEIRRKPLGSMRSSGRGYQHRSGCGSEGC